MRIGNAAGTAELEVTDLGVRVVNPSAFGASLTDIVGLVRSATTTNGPAT